MSTTKSSTDILTVIADLSNDEVFTPPWVADRILDLLPSEVWTDPALRWLDPGCKTGVFLRNAAQRLMVGLEPAIPDEVERRHHILTNMLHGMAITELTALMSRRTLYSSKDAAGPHSDAPFTDPAGNIWYQPSTHPVKNNRCIDCGAPASMNTAAETHTYSFIHPHLFTQFKETHDMQFDVIIGNPPYQTDTEGHGAQAKPLYHLFVEQAIALNPRYLSMIIPSRWFAGGMGLNKFRERMMNDARITALVDYTNAGEVFPHVEIKGGVCYFLWEREPIVADGLCEYTNHTNGEVFGPVRRALNSDDVLIRHVDALDILTKVQAAAEPTLDQQVSPISPFGFPTNFTGYSDEPFHGAIKLYANKKIRWVSQEQITIRPELVGKWKVLIPRASSDGGKTLPDVVLGRPIVAAPKSCCTFTYLVAGTYDTQEEAENFAAYLRTRFARYLVSLKKNTQDTNRSKFGFVPQLDMTRRWTDTDLYQKYEITEDQQTYIAEMIKEMPA